MNDFVTYKSACLSGVSWPSLQIGCGGVLGTVGDPVSGRAAGVRAFLIWVRIWLDWLRGGDAGEMCAAPAPSGYNRYQRRVNARKISSLRNLSSYRPLLGRGLSPRQFLDRVSRISPLGRLRLLGISHWGNVLVRRAMLVCYDHGWWRAPIGEFGCVYCGVWYVHMLPGWRVCPHQQANR